VATQKTKLRADMMLIDREIKNRKKLFGVELFNLMEEAEVRQGNQFWDKHNEAVLALKDAYLRNKQDIHEFVGRINGKVVKLNFVEERRVNEIQEDAQTFKEKMVNAGKTVNMAGNEAKLRSQMAIMNTKIKAKKEEFGLEVFPILAELEDKKGCIPTDRDMRSCYDRSRQEVLKIEKRKEAKFQTLRALGGGVGSPKNTVDDFLRSWGGSSIKGGGDGPKDAVDEFIDGKATLKIKQQKQQQQEKENHQEQPITSKNEGEKNNSARSERRNSYSPNNNLNDDDDDHHAPEIDKKYDIDNTDDMKDVEVERDII